MADSQWTLMLKRMLKSKRTLRSRWMKLTRPKLIQTKSGRIDLRLAQSMPPLLKLSELAGSRSSLGLKVGQGNVAHSMMGRGWAPRRSGQRLRALGWQLELLSPLVQ